MQKGAKKIGWKQPESVCCAVMQDPPSTAHVVQETCLGAVAYLKRDSGRQSDWTWRVDHTAWLKGEDVSESDFGVANPWRFEILIC